MTTQPTTLEEALQAVERDADAAIKSLGAALKVAKQAKAAAALGQIRDLQQAHGRRSRPGRPGGRSGRRPALGMALRRGRVVHLR